ncbi:helix-turn-helix domain-containing protein [Mucilaginibacter pedocola]|uniref:AraC family transcriptional regulator n=1 Tax=Mucilaginibacter pedocola TaxID=1792845 RepID=A0A1S9PB20_9SPHI|nr:AraC family transcriptional regulator [Mucilaginibacter pedocola]OOQ58129.1 AraC family transcriptional regulator [Mucilaginibacter pedocola]
MPAFKQFSFKKFGYIDIVAGTPAPTAAAEYEQYIKVLYIKAGGRVIVDFKEYDLGQDALFFVHEAQVLKVNDNCSGTMLYYNRDFYCVEMHDHEVACDGILFRNVYEVPVVFIEPERAPALESIFTEIKAELELNDSSVEEMLRLLLKRIIIKATRIWKQVHHVAGEDAHSDVEFLRSFSKLVDKHYNQYHTVADYAGILNISPKALNKRITRYSDATPNDIIKNRIMLEAKRLLVHTALSVKEIGYKLGYDDPNYFVRLFTNQAELSPLNFRQQYQLGMAG